MGVKITRRAKSSIVVTREHTPSGVIKHIVVNGGLNQVPKAKAATKKVKPLAPEISLFQPGRLRVNNLMSLFGVSRTTLYTGINGGRYPEPDGKDGRIPYWNTETIRVWLANKQP